jgi:integrase
MADMGLQVLSRVCAHGVDLGKIAGNPCIGIKQLYSGDRSGIIWTDADIACIKAAGGAEIGHAVDLAAHTGLRRGDLLRLSWSHIGADAIAIPTSKSKGKREAVIPLYDRLRDVLARIPRQSPIVLTNPKGRPWTDGAFSAAFNRAKIAAGIEGLHFHDLRGTAATRFYVANIRLRSIAEIMGWEEEHVERIIRKYVDRSASVRALIRQLNKGTD